MNVSQDGWFVLFCKAGMECRIKQNKERKEKRQKKKEKRKIKLKLNQVWKRNVNEEVEDETC